MPGASDSSRARAALVALTLLPLLPFLSAAVSIDAPVFLAVARQIVAHPLDPFGFDMIWDPTSPHVARFNQNPPLLSYYLAPWIAAFGEREAVLHAALLPFPLIAALSFHGIARRLVGSGLAPTALLVATPAFLLLATTLMLDVPVLAWMLLAVLALLRANESPGARRELAAGLAVAAAGLTKYVGFASAPLLAAGALLLPLPGSAGHPAPRVQAMRLLRMVALPLAIWASWGVYTHHLYGRAHFLGGLALAGERGMGPDQLFNQVLSIPIYYGGALLFPLFVWVAALRRTSGGATELAVLGLLAGTAVVMWVLPEGRPSRRVPLGTLEAVLGALSFAGALLVWARCLRPQRVWAQPVDRFLAVWLVGFLVFSIAVNWHVNAADALLAAPPVILLLFRNADTRPSERVLALWIAIMLPFSMLLAFSDVAQRDVYRSVARRIAVEIGEQPGRRWFVGHWGFQHYLEREGFRAVVPAQYERAYGRSELARGDWIASARNVSQLDVSRNLRRFRVLPVWSWTERAPVPLRTTNPDAGAGFYSHHVGYVPFAWSRAPLEEIGLGRIGSVAARTGSTGFGGPRPPPGIP
jgi:4-amino-4-deoxy-L-arabinose transferase-like glycosyltransferase